MMPPSEETPGEEIRFDTMTERTAKRTRRTRELLAETVLFLLIAIRVTPGECDFLLQATPAMLREGSVSRGRTLSAKSDR